MKFIIGLILEYIIQFLIGLSEKSGITDSIYHNPRRNRIDSYNCLHIEKKLTLHNAIILIKSVFNRDKNNYCYNIFLERDLYKESSTQYF